MDGVTIEILWFYGTRLEWIQAIGILITGAAVGRMLRPLINGAAQRYLAKKNRPR